MVLDIIYIFIIGIIGSWILVQFQVISVSHLDVLLRARSHKRGARSVKRQGVTAPLMIAFTNLVTVVASAESGIHPAMTALERRRASCAAVDWKLQASFGDVMRDGVELLRRVLEAL